MGDELDGSTPEKRLARQGLRPIHVRYVDTDGTLMDGFLLIGWSGDADQVGSTDPSPTAGLEIAEGLEFAMTTWAMIARETRNDKAVSAAMQRIAFQSAMDRSRYWVDGSMLIFVTWRN